MPLTYSVEETAIREYILQKMSSPDAPNFIKEGQPFDVPPGHVLHGKTIPVRVLKDDKGSIYIADPTAVLGKGSYGVVLKGEVVHSTNPKMAVGAECALKNQDVNSSKENQLLRDVGLCYGDCSFTESGKTSYCTIMPLLPGKEMSKMIESYEGYSPPTGEAIDTNSSVVVRGSSAVIAPAVASDLSDVAGTVVLNEVPVAAPAIPAPAAPAPSGTVVYSAGIPAPAAPAPLGTVVYSAGIPAPAAPAPSGTVVYPAGIPAPAAPAPSGTVVYPAGIPAPAPPAPSGTVVYPAAISAPAAATPSGTVVINPVEQASTPAAVVPAPGVSEPSGTVVINPVEQASKPGAADPPSTGVRPKREFVIREYKRGQDAEEDDDTSASLPTTIQPGYDHPFTLVSPTNPEEFKIDRWLTRARNLALEVKQRAHDNGIVHLDIKPQNFMCTADDEVVLIDFGISERVSDKTAPEIKGTPIYIAPEMFNVRNTAPHSTKQDMYSLGRTYELLIHGDMENLYADAYQDRPADDALFSHFKKMTMSPHLTDFYFENPGNNPDIEAINDFMKIIYEMRSLKAELRPEAKEVAARLSAIQEKYRERTGFKAAPVQEQVKEQAKELSVRDQVKEALKGTEFKGPKVGHVFQASQAIEQYNQKKLREWVLKPQGERGVKPTALAVPNATELKEILQELDKEKNEKLAAGGPENPVVAVNSGAPGAGAQEKAEPAKPSGILAKAAELVKAEVVAVKEEKQKIDPEPVKAVVTVEVAAQVQANAEPAKAAVAAKASDVTLSDLKAPKVEAFPSSSIARQAAKEVLDEFFLEVEKQNPSLFPAKSTVPVVKAPAVVSAASPTVSEAKPPVVVPAKASEPTLSDLKAPKVETFTSSDIMRQAAKEALDEFFLEVEKKNPSLFPSKGAPSSPVAQAKASAEVYSERKFDANINGGLLFSKAVVQEQRKDRQQELESVKGLGIVSEALSKPKAPKAR